MRSPTYSSTDVESGLILLDSSRAVVALDRGAAAILNYRRNRSREPVGWAIDPSILETLHPVSDPSCVETMVGISDNFTCRTYLLESQDASQSLPFTALLIEKHKKVRDTIDEVAAQYHLTKREQQTLRGLSLGLSTKVLAAKMNIKPSTLRAFLRLIKIKMGVPTRAALMVKLLQRR